MANDPAGDPDGAAPVIGELSAGDATLAVVAAIVSAVPMVGGPVAAIASEIRRTFDRRQGARLAAAVDDLRATLEQLGSHVDRDLGVDPGFASFVEAALESTAQARHAEKRRYYVALMARSATAVGPGEIERLILLDTLDRVQRTHLRLLHAVATGPAPVEIADYYREGTKAYTAVRDALPGLDDMFLHRIWEDMVLLGLMNSWTDYLVTEQSPVSTGSGAVTPFGRRFLAFVAPF